MVFQKILFIFIFLLGLSVGSFLNCLIYRIQIKKTVQGRSFCPRCKHQLKFWDLIPVFSFFFLRGRCRYCGEKISFQYPFVELLTGSVFLFAYLFLNPQTILSIIIFFLTLFIFSCLIVIFIYDAKYYIIPNIIIYPAIITSLLIILIDCLRGDCKVSIFAILSGIFAFLLFFLIYFFSKGKGIGFGDVRYAAFMGFFLGFPDILVGLFFSFITGAIIGLILIALNRKSRKDMIPFGPFLVLGTFIAFFFGEEIINWYLFFL